MNGAYIVVNLKTYRTGLGEEALNIGRVMEEVARETGARIAIAASALDVYRLKQELSIPVLAQHADPVGHGSNTGRIMVEHVKEMGADGLLINHAEDQRTIADIDALIQKCRELGLETIVCTNNIRVSAACSALRPDFVAVEPPELIGGDISVSTAEPEIISGSVEAVRNVAPDVGVLCGAGVKNGVDVRTSKDLGAAGVLLASGVTMASDVKAVLMDLIE